MRANLVVLVVSLVAGQLTGSARNYAQSLALTGVDPNQYRYADFEKFRGKSRAGDSLIGDVIVSGGSLPWDSIQITVTCNGKVNFTTTTDAHGNFAITRQTQWDTVTIIGKEKSFTGQFVGCSVAAVLPGFQSSQVMIANHDIQSSPNIGSIKLTPEPGSAGSAVSATTASAPKDAMKSFQKARSDWLNSKPDRAVAQLQKAVQIYPQFAEAWYVLGRLEAGSNPHQAERAFNQAIAADRNFVPAYEQLAALAAQEMKWQEVVVNASRALQLNPQGNLDVWYYHALGNFELKNLDVAERSAVQSLSMDPLHSQPATEQLLAAILMAKHDKAGALQHLRNCLTYFPPGPNLDLVKRQIAKLEMPTKGATAKPAESAAGAAAAKLPSIPTHVPSENAARPRGTGSCRIDDVLPKVTLHVEEFVENVNRFTATEDLVRERLDRDGDVKDRAQSRSNYIATIQKLPSGFFVVDEYHDQRLENSSLPGAIRANVAPALALIFHPSHIDEYEMECEGPVDWLDYKTWRVDFWQRRDRPATMIGFELGHKEYTVLLKGSAWVDINNYQIVHMETDLLQPIPDLKLDGLHQSVDYGSVAFAGAAGFIWLPQTAEVTADVQGKRLVERHTYSKFQIFSIDTREKVSEPPEPPN